MPKAMLDKLPDKARDIYEAAWEQAKEDGHDDETAAKIAITAVKRAGYSKDDETGQWRKMHLVSMHITKAAMGGDGIMRWAATTSKFETDDQGDELTPDFYLYAKAQVAAGKRPEPVLCVSHIDHGKPDDSWVPGNVTDFYIDRGLPKAKGIFRDTPLGQAAFQAVRDDYGKTEDQKIRISLGFYDEGSEPKETQKADGSEIKGRRYLKGWIKHLALTRVPVVKETEITVMEGKGMAKTKKEDAASIVGEELAKDLVRSVAEEKAELDDGLVLKAEEDLGERDDLSEEKPEEEKAETEEKAEIEEKSVDTVPHVAVKAEIEAETGGRKNQIRDLLRQLADLLESEWTVDQEIANAAALGNKGTNPPTTVEMARTSDESGELPPELDEVLLPDQDEKAKVLSTRQPPTPEAVEVAAFVDSWAMQVKATLLGDGDRREKFVTLQQLLNTFGEGVQALVKGSTPPSSRDIADVVAEAVRAAVEPVQNQLAGVKAELDDLKAKGIVLGEAPAAPTPKSLDSKARVITQSQSPLMGGPALKPRTAQELAWISTQERPAY